MGNEIALFDSSRILATPAASALKKFAADVQCGLHIFFAHGFGGMVADAAGAAQKEHRRGHARGHHHGVVAGAAGHLLHAAIQRPQSRRQETPSAAHPSARPADPVRSVRCKREPAPFGDRLALSSSCSTAAMRAGVMRVPHVEAHRHAPGNHVAGVGFHVDLAHRGDQALSPLRELTPLRRSIRRQPASASWRRRIGVVPA